MRMVIDGLVRLHDAVFGGLQMLLADWFLGLTARLVFGSVLLIYFWHSATLKVISGEPTGLLDYLTVEENALFQMAPKAIEAAGYDPSALGGEYWLMAYAGTYAEFVLPLLVLIGLFTRLASLGMIGFILVQSWVDVTGHDADESTIGSVFDRIPDSALLDQRLLWIFPLLYLIVRGAGLISVDALLRSTRG
ncbi:MAG: DoxX family protein [Pseudomonadota bacterium]